MTNTLILTTLLYPADLHSLQSQAIHQVYIYLILIRPTLVKAKLPNQYLPQNMKYMEGCSGWPKRWDIGRPVQAAVQEALHHNLNYGMFLYSTKSAPNHTSRPRFVWT